MDKNTIIGFVLIALIFVGYSQLNKKSDAEIAAEKRYNDSITLVQQTKAEAIPTGVTGAKGTSIADSVANNDTSKIANTYGDFSVSAAGEEKFYTLENEL